MDTSQVKILNSPGVYGRSVHAWSREASPPERSASSAPMAFQLTAEEGARFLRIVSEGALISRHYDIYQWLKRDVQHFLPHDILVSAWGDFAHRSVKLDITSGLAEVRTRRLAHCRVDDLTQHAYEQWVDGGRQPLLLNTADITAPRACGCPIHAALSSMRSGLVHGVRDERGGHESLYVALSTESFIHVGRRDRFMFLVHALIGQIDVAFRKVAAFPLEAAKGPEACRASWLDLSRREQQILERVCRGNTNIDIAAALAISPYTVKNHMQRIFRKIGVNNRTQAADRYNQAVRASGNDR